MRLAPVMLALLLALSPSAVAMQASAPTTPATTTQTDTVGPAMNENTTAVLTLGTDPDRTAFDSPSVSLGSSLETAHGEFRSDLSAKSLETQLRDADSDEEKKRILNRYRFRIENRIISLETKERDVMRAFSNGTISANQYAQALGRINAEASEIRRTIRAMEESAEGVSNFALQNEARALEAKLVSFEGPVRDRIAETLHGTADSTRFYVATTDSGIVLSTIIDGKYVREVYRADHRDPGATGTMSLEAAEESVIKPQYSWVVENRRGTNHWDFQSVQILRFIYHHPHGNLTAYVDTGTEEVFREIQYKRLSGQGSLPPGPGVQNTTEARFGGENVTLTVNRTYAGGPLRVRLTNETGEPLDGAISVGGEPMGQTGDDGVLWTLAPAEEFRVSGTHDGTAVNVTTAPMELDRQPSED